MHKSASQYVSAIDGTVKPDRYGCGNGDAGVVVNEVGEVGLALVMARRGRRAALNDAVRSAFGVDLPSVPRRTEGRALSFIWAGPDQWLAYQQSASAGLEVTLRNALASLASVVDQSHGRTVLRVTGPKVRDALAKGLAVDLHPRVFQPGHAAVTAVAHISVHLWQTDERPTYEIAVPRASALSYWHWLETSSAQYGLEFV